MLPILVILLSSALVAGEICTSPQVTSVVHSTSDSQLSSGTAIVVEFELACSNKAQDVNLHAEFHGKTFPVTKISENKYQVSYSEEHKKIPKGSYMLRLFDDEAYSELRKVQRSGEDSSAVKTSFTIDVHHQGTSRGPWIQTEHIATAGVVLVFYLAYSMRNSLQS
ncbi:hypothetical protein HELRODRAFT_113378 [Helobdella robusta]|uniref:Translocon-associated protein subunit delta n=1 Tax=Helobdella robusta TaxID=6412 RepID=T1EFS1_HELRO|nr:hypothetical protein HELRODRAFT_113378 [Helobdella robusta]ESN99964.1 hypothetical protein HELRODRAFT_113378 [Helobdella robusta]